MKDGDANTKFFHLQSCHRRRKCHIPAFIHEGRSFVSDGDKAEAAFNYYNGILGARFVRLHRTDLGRLRLPTLDLQPLAEPFTEEEILRILQHTP